MGTEGLKSINYNDKIKMAMKIYLWKFEAPVVTLTKPMIDETRLLQPQFDHMSQEDLKYSIMC